MQRLTFINTSPYSDQNKRPTPLHVHTTDIHTLAFRACTHQKHLYYFLTYRIDCRSSFPARKRKVGGCL